MLVHMHVSMADIVRKIKKNNYMLIKECFIEGIQNNKILDNNNNEILDWIHQLPENITREIDYIPT